MMEVSPPQRPLPSRLLPHDAAVHTAAGVDTAAIPWNRPPEAIPESNCRGETI